MRILLAEDDLQLAERIRAALSSAGFVVLHAANGRDAEYLGHVEPIDAVVLDLGLPCMDGLTALERWRQADLAMPVLVLTARSRWHDKLAGFEAGADDYMTKPFHAEELVLRLRALIRRSAGHAHPRLRCGPLVLDVNAARFELDDLPLHMTVQEQRILSYFMHHQGQLISRNRLGEHVYEAGFDPDSNVLDVLIGRIRRKLGTAELLHTVRGQGYRLSHMA